MTVKELLDKINNLVNNDHSVLNLPAYVIADHGQDAYKARTVSIEYTEEYLENCIEEILDGEEVENFHDVNTFLLIGGD